MTRIYFLRHGQSEWNVLNKVQGKQNSTLTRKGVNQARQAARRLEKEKIDRIFSSDLSRAYETAKIIGEKKGLYVEKIKEFQEMSFGDWEGLYIKDIEKNYNEDFLKWTKTPEHTSFPNGETLAIVEEKVSNKLKEIVKENKDKNILIVSHGTTIKTLILSLLGMPLNNYKNLSLGNVSLSIVEIRDYNNVLTLYNDRSHVKDEDLNE